MATPLIDPSRYLHAPRVGVRSALGLAKMLLTVVPEDAGPAVDEAALTLGRSRDELEARWMSRVYARPLEDARPYDHRLDRAWSAVSGSLDRYAIFDSDDPDRQRATGLHALLFPTGLDFLKLPYIEQYVESSRRVEQIEQEGLREDLDRLVGEDFIHELLAAHQAYGVVLGVTSPSEVVPPVPLDGPLRALTRAISRYALQVLAFADRDPEHNTTAARRALWPIDVLRQRSARRSAGRGPATVGADDEGTGSLPAGEGQARPAFSAS
ncbi:MAG: hypothetical protein AAGF11_06325 [Myxococcota bacterium]